ncbi:PREDICTED: sorting nexin-29 isoform X2 [Ceratosolen solmsi marchali]|nr:PREDICTED: sorting nexin-29 isoform X2 [Ceratosolen solmsi marchali]
MMSAIVPGTHSISDNPHVVDHAASRLKLQQDLLSTAKQCHIRFGGKAELATDSDACVTHLCNAFEQIFTHGLKISCTDKLNSTLRQVSELVKSGGYLRSPESEAFWPCIREQLTWHEQERFSVLRKVHTDQGRGRAWLRAALNERSLERHLHAIVSPEAVQPYYENWAFLVDQEKSSMLPNVAAGLTTILFAIRIDNEELNYTLEENKIARCKNSHFEPIITAALPDPSMTSLKPRKKVQTHIISFDDDEIDNEVASSSVSFSAPPTCLNSPSATSTKETSPVSPCLPSSRLQQHSGSNDVVLDVQPINWDERETFEEERLLTPLTDNENMGGLVPVSPLDSVLDDTLVNLASYIDNYETTEAAVEATEPLVDTHAEVDTLDVEGLRARLLALNEVLEQTREDAITSKHQLARFQRQHQNYLEKHELQIQTLNRENELLRQQLRKYVTAVQMLRKDSDANNVTDEDSSLDYHKESQEYQSKLVQVAEMHAELMEFNARLTIQLTNKDKLVKLLRAELECLRGPINEDNMPSEAPCLIHIWVPSAFLTGQPSDIHHVYQIYIRIRDTEWNIYRRYAQFHLLYRDLKKHDTIVTSFEFPPKKSIGNKDAKFVEERRQKLQQWLRRIVNRLSHCSLAFSSHPSKQTLIALMPFFGDFPNNEESERNNSNRNTYSSSPQYMGL